MVGGGWSKNRPRTENDQNDLAPPPDHFLIFLAPKRKKTIFYFFYKKSKKIDFFRFGVKKVSKSGPPTPCMADLPR